MPPDNNLEKRDYDQHLADLQEKLCKLEEKLDPVILIWERLSGLATTLYYIGKTVKWVGSVVIVVAGAWATITHIK